MLSAAIALACYRFFSNYAGDETKIKWPNDLYWRDRKAGGILVENVLKGQDWKFAIAGMGININQTSFPEHLLNPVSLKQITGKTFDPLNLAKELCLKIDEVLNEMKSGGTENIIQQYNTVLYKRNEKVKLKKSIAVFETIIREVKSDGLLITEDTMVRSFDFGEVEWV